MRRPLLFLVVLPVLAWGDPARAQEIKHPADVMPAKTLAYGEIRHIGQLGQEIGALFAGSALSNVPESLQKIRGKYEKALAGGWARDTEMLGAFGLMLAPEVVKELQRVQGIAASLTGVTPDGEPEFIAVVLPGESNAPGFMFRALLTMAPMQSVGTCEGVTLYRLRGKGKKGGKDGKEIEEPPTYGPVFAMTKSALLAGSLDNVKETIRRIKGKADGPSLGQDKTFQEARKAIADQPGLFIYANPGEIIQAVEQHVRKRDREVLELVKGLLNPKGFRAVAYGLTLDKGNLHFREVALLDPKEKIPLLDVLPAKALDPALLHFAPRDAIVAVALSNADGEKRWEKGLALADALCPNKEKPSEFIKELEAKLKVNFGKDLAGPITGIAFALGDPLNAPIRRVEEKGENFTHVHSGPELPMVFIVQAENGQAAQKLVELVPALYGAIGKSEEKLPPARETIKGQELYVLKTPKKGNWTAALYYGRHESTVVLGPYGAPVAESLNAGAKQKGLLSDPRAADRIKAMNDPIALVLAKPGSLIVGAGMMLVHEAGVSHGKSNEFPKEFPKDKEPPKKGDEAPKGEKGSRDNVAPPPARRAAAQKTEIKESIVPRSPEEDKLMKALSKIMEQEEWLVLGVTRKADRIQVDGEMSGLRNIVPQLTDFIIDQVFQNEARRMERMRKDRERFDKEKEKRFDEGK